MICLRPSIASLVRIGIVLAFSSLTGFAFPTAACFADQIIVTESDSNIISGDFCCSTYKMGQMDSLPIVPNSTMTAGELWQFFKDRGIDRMDKLVLCVENPLDRTNISLASLDLIIKDPKDPDGILQHYSLDREHSILFPSYEASAFRPDAQLSIDLGFDFMQRYSAFSDEEVILKTDSSSNSILKFSLAAEPPDWFSEISMPRLALFCSFWLAVFAILFKLTNPNRVRRMPRAAKRQNAFSA